MISPGRPPASSFTTNSQHPYLLPVLLQLLPQLPVLLLRLLQLRPQLHSVDFHGGSQVFLQVVDGVVGLVALLVQANQCAGEVVDDSSFFEVLAELFLLGLGGLTEKRLI